MRLGKIKLKVLFYYALLTFLLPTNFEAIKFFNSV